MKIFSLKLILTSAVLFSLLIFTGCFGSDDTDPVTPPTTNNNEILPFYRLVDGADFSIQVPEDWETIQKFSVDYPANTVIAFRNNIADHDFIANINIVRNEITEGTILVDYASETYQTISTQLLSFKELKKEELSSGQIYEFEGINDPALKSKRFIQFYVVKGVTAYIVTGTYDAQDAPLAIDQLKASVKTFLVK
ncbi:MAG: hypothetical protein UT36_C0003G0128 [Candidatus Peregrinibacteria bacterium GW2011_GWF2_39_17]|nr:MAG: hypothetical protein UT36_C0003G0128 [Candidatus Peregrinibacteria bacterium GW2011_GWF2_39_17]HCW32321.1 hypothetical protein [Candidatus Peregrinibacteria bacterium]